MASADRFEDLPMFLTPEQVAEITNVHVKSIRRSLKNGALPGDKIGNKWVIYKYVVFGNTWKAVFGDGPEADGE